MLIKRFIESGEPLEELRTAMNGIFVMAGFINFAVITLGGLLLSHRISGPLYRLKQHMLAIARGDKVERLKFRDGDFFQDLAETFNKQRESKK
jgi:methyl-accepting chemotaxis protein